MQKSILITGGGSGIGKETAKLFASKGWRVGVADLNAATAQVVAEEIGPNAVPVAVDVSSIDACAAMVSSFMAHTGGRLDVMFNCAGVLFMGPHENIAQSKQDLMIDVNVKGVVNCSNAAFDALKATPNAHLISMCSTSSEFGPPDHAVYGATKFFVRGFTEALNIEWTRHDVNVSAITVAYVQTPMMSDAKTKAASVDKLGVKITPEQVAKAVWTAANKRGSIHRLGLDAKMLNIFVRLLGNRSKVLYRRLTGY